MTHICVSKLTIIDSDNGLSPGRRQAIIWTNDGLLLIWPLGTNFSEILIEIHSFSFKKMHLKMSSEKMTAILSRSQCVKISSASRYIYAMTVPIDDLASTVTKRSTAPKLSSKSHCGISMIQNHVFDQTMSFKMAAEASPNLAALRFWLSWE